MTELKKCPFCGGEAEYSSRVEVNPVIDANGAYVDADVFYYESCGCPSCDIWFYNEEDEPEEITIKKWNMRAET